MIHGDITERIISACFEVADELGSGFVESVYEKALAITLKQNGLKIKYQHPIKVIFRNECVGEFFADILVEDKVIVELKATKALLVEHSAQVINYLNATGIDVGLLVNFGPPKIEYRRLVRGKMFQKIKEDNKQG
jgi:GxxExxY protein